MFNQMILQHHVAGNPVCPTFSIVQKPDNDSCVENVCIASTELLSSIRNMFSGERDVALRRLDRGYRCISEVCQELYGQNIALHSTSPLVTGARDLESAKSYLEEGDIKNALSNTYIAYRRLQLSLAQIA